MKVLSKQDWTNFVSALIADEASETVGVKAKGDKFVFDVLDSAQELRLDYDVTILPPKKYFLPQFETKMTFDIGQGTTAKPAAEKKRIIIGIHAQSKREC